MHVTANSRCSSFDNSKTITVEVIGLDRWFTQIFMIFCIDFLVIIRFL